MLREIVKYGITYNLDDPQLKLSLKERHIGHRIHQQANKEISGVKVRLLGMASSFIEEISKKDSMAVGSSLPSSDKGNVCLRSYSPLLVSGCSSSDECGEDPSNKEIVDCDGYPVRDKDMIPATRACPSLASVSIFSSSK